MPIHRIISEQVLPYQVKKMIYLTLNIVPFFCFRLQLVRFLWGTLWNNINDDFISNFSRSLLCHYQASAVHKEDFKETLVPDHSLCLAVLTGLECVPSPWVE